MSDMLSFLADGPKKTCLTPSAGAGSWPTQLALPSNYAEDKKKSVEVDLKFSTIVSMVGD